MGFRAVNRMKFKDREDAGHHLTSRLMAYFKDPLGIVIALPRGGLLVGAVIAEKLHLPLDVICSRKIPHPQHAEYAIGAVTESGEPLFHDAVKDSVAAEVARQQKEAQRRLRLYRQGKAPRSLRGRHVILVDDGLATGLTMEAAILTAHAEGAARLILAVPAAPPETLQRLSKLVDEIICLIEDANFYAVGHYYEDFSQVSDATVIALMTIKDRLETNG